MIFCKMNDSLKLFAGVLKLLARLAVRYYKKKRDTLNYRKEAFYETGEPDYIGHIVNGKKEGGLDMVVQKRQQKGFVQIR